MVGTPTQGRDAARPSGPPYAEEGAEPDNTLVPLALRRAQDGDRDAFAFLYARYADDVYLHVRRILGDDDEAQDVVQRVFERLIHAIGAYEERHGPFLHWVLRLARCVAGEHLCQSSAPIDARQVAVHEIAMWSAPPPMPR
jgi:DNA-directed RNA polymerase specialized sigma24 family protein